MEQSGARVRSVSGISYGFRPVPVNQASEYAATAARALDSFGVTDYFIFESEIQANRVGETVGHSSDGATLRDGFIGICNEAKVENGSLDPEEVAAHETIHQKINRREDAALAYAKTVASNLNKGSLTYKIYSNAINAAYFGWRFDTNNKQHVTKFVEELSAFVSGHIYAGTRDASGMFHNYGEVCSTLEKALGVQTFFQGILFYLCHFSE